MNYFSWIAQEQELSDASLSVRAQAVDPENVDGITYDLFFPVRRVNSTSVREVGTVDFRPVSDRREWNTRGRQIVERTPDFYDMEFNPIETYFEVNEYEMQKLANDAGGEIAAVRRRLRQSIPDRVDSRAQANVRRTEMDACQAWAKGTVIVRHPHTGATQTVAFGFEAGRYQTAATAWNDPGVNAWDEFIAWIEEGRTSVLGGIRGARTTRAIYEAIRADAPDFTGLGIPLTRRQFEDGVVQTLGQEFTWYIIETEFDVFTDGGLATTRQRVWPDEIIAAVPNGVAVGNTLAAPVLRAYELAGMARDAELDVRGQSVFKEIANGGRSLVVEIQANWFPFPNEQKLWVMDTGVVTP